MPSVLVLCVSIMSLHEKEHVIHHDHRMVIRTDADTSFARFLSADWGCHIGPVQTPGMTM